MMTESYKKRKGDGLVINMNDTGLAQYQQAKKSTKALLNTKHELDNTKYMVYNLQNELHEMREMIQQLLDKKT